jgi:hypothetical protein
MILSPLVFPGWYAECHSDKRRGAGTSSQALSFAGGYRGTITTTADSSPPKFRLKINENYQRKQQARTEPVWFEILSSLLVTKVSSRIFTHLATL